MTAYPPGVGMAEVHTKEEVSEVAVRARGLEHPEKTEGLTRVFAKGQTGTTMLCSTWEERTCS